MKKCRSWVNTALEQQLDCRHKGLRTVVPAPLSIYSMLVNCRVNKNAADKWKSFGTGREVVARSPVEVNDEQKRR